MHLLALIGALAIASAAQADPHPAKTTSTPRDSREIALDAIVSRRMRDFGIPGVQVGVVLHGRMILAKSYGMASVELGVPVTDQTLFSINSTTKGFSGVAVAQLVAQRKLDADAPIGRYLDDLPATWRGVTVAQLMAHMSGLPDIMRAPTIDSDPAAAWAWTMAQPVRFAPGARYDYCQTNYVLVQRIVNRLRGLSDDTPLALGQFASLGMHHSRYGDSDDVVQGKAPSYRFRFPSPGAAGTLHPVYERFPPLLHGSAGINSTATDMAAWAGALLDGTLVDRAARERMWMPVLFADGSPGEWGLGWQVLKRGDHRMVGMTGGGRSAVFLYPEDNLAIVVLTNLAGAYPEDFIDAIAKVYAPDLPLAGVPALRIALEANGYDRIEKVAQEIGKENPSAVFPEAELNDWGYRLLGSGRPHEALKVLALVADFYPKSGNAWDSLGEAYAANGKREEAIAAYRRSLELDRSNRNAEERLRKLEQ